MVSDSSATCRSYPESAVVLHGRGHSGVPSGVNEADADERAREDRPDPTNVARPASLFCRLSGNCEAVGVGRPLAEDAQSHFSGVSPREAVAVHAGALSADKIPQGE